MTGFSHGPDLDATLASPHHLCCSTGWSDDEPHRLEGPHSLEVRIDHRRWRGTHPHQPEHPLVHRRPGGARTRSSGCSETVLALTIAAYEGASGDPPHLWLLPPGAHGLPCAQDALVAPAPSESIPLPLVGMRSGWE